MPPALARDSAKLSASVPRLSSSGPRDPPAFPPRGRLGRARPPPPGEAAGRRCATAYGAAGPGRARPAPRGRRLRACCAGTPPGGHSRGLTAKGGRGQRPGCQGQPRGWWQPSVVCPRSKRKAKPLLSSNLFKSNFSISGFFSLHFDILLQAFCIFFYLFSAEKVFCFVFKYIYVSISTL